MLFFKTAITPLHDPRFAANTCFTSSLLLAAQHMGRRFTCLPANQHPAQLFDGAGSTLKSVAFLSSMSIVKKVNRLKRTALILPPGRLCLSHLL